MSDSTESRQSSPGPEAFVTTQWTRVLEACGDSPDAEGSKLGDLCAAYYEPVFAFMRRNAPDEEAARALTQEFFSRLLGAKALIMLTRCEAGSVPSCSAR